MPIIEIHSLTDPRIEIFSTLTEAQLRNRIESDKGLFIAESPKVINVALNAGYEPLALYASRSISLVMLLISLNVVMIYLSIRVQENCLPH